MKTNRFFIFLALLASIGNTAFAAAPTPQKLRVSDNGRFFVTADGQPFYWQGDTAWELFARLNREDAVLYLNDRAERRFNVFQAAAISCFTGAGKNAHGDRPCEGTVDKPYLTPGNDPNDAAQYDYWDHVEFIIDEAAKRGIYASVSVAWQNQFVLEGDKRPLNAANSEAFARFLGERFGRKPNVIWQVVGDATEEKQTEPQWREVWRSIARGLAVGAVGAEDYSRILISFHPAGPGVSSKRFADERWLAFHSAQSGHNKDQQHPHALIDQALRAEPLKPVVDYEPPYDDLLRDDQKEWGRNDDVDARKSAYWAVFAGALGHTYGHAAVFQMWHPAIKGWDGVRVDWKTALKASGGDDMRHLRALVESRPQLSRVPDQGLIVEPGAGPDHVRALRGDGYAFVYSAMGKPFAVDTSRLGAKKLVAWWFDPREGTAKKIESFNPTTSRTFTPPSSGRGHDWALVLDDVEKKFEKPGAVNQ